MRKVEVGYWCDQPAAVPFPINLTATLDDDSTTEVLLSVEEATALRRELKRAIKASVKAGAPELNYGGYE